MIRTVLGALLAHPNGRSAQDIARDLGGVPVQVVADRLSRLAAKGGVVEVAGQRGPLAARVWRIRR